MPLRPTIYRPTIYRSPAADRNDPFLGVAMGSKARDTITGVGGFVIARVEHATGCNQVLIAPPVGKDEVFRDPLWFDVERLIVEEENAVSFTSRPGGGLPPGQVPPTRHEGP